MPDILSEGTLVTILKYEKRPEFESKEAEIGNYSAKDGTYECWLTDDALEGCYALCVREDFELKNSPPVQELSSAPTFAVGDRVRGKESGNMGTVVEVDSDGDPKVKMDGEDEAQQRFGKEFEVVEKAAFGVGDRVRGKETGKLGTVVSIDEDGDPKVRLDGEDEAKQRFGNEFEVVEKAKSPFSVGDRVRGKETGKLGTVVAVDADGDPKVKLDDEEEALQRFGKEFEVVDKRGRSASKEGKKKKKKKSSSSSSGSSSSPSRKRKRTRSASRHKKKKSGFGRSTLEQREDDKRNVRKMQRKMDKGSSAALNLLGLV